MAISEHPWATANKRKPFLICFVGIDGAGKTIQAQKLVKWLREQGIEAKYVWNKYEPWVLKPAMKVGRGVFLRGQDMFRDYASYRESKQRAFRIPILPALFQFLYLAEYPLHVFFRIKLPLLMNKNVVCDRYFYDVVVGTSSDFNYSESKTSRVLGVFTRLLPKPDVIFLIDLPEAIAYQRKDDIPSVDFLKQKRQIYLKMAESCNMDILDGNQNLEEIADIIRSKVGKLLA